MQSDILASMQVMPVLGHILVDNLNRVNQSTEASALRIMDRLQGLQVRCHELLDVIDRQLDRVVADAESGDRLRDSLAEVARRSREAMQAIHLTVLDINGDCQFQDMVRQQIDLVGVAIQEIAGYFGRHGQQAANDPGPVSDDQPLTGLLHRLESAYVMQVQRDIHGHVLGLEVRNDEVPRIELF